MSPPTQIVLPIDNLAISQLIVASAADVLNGHRSTILGPEVKKIRYTDHAHDLVLLHKRPLLQACYKP